MSKLKPNLSACILALNEEKHIRQALQSIKDLADEIIVVVDDRTIDRTAEIAKQFSSQVIIQKHQDNFHINKQFALEQADGDWIFWLDADEEVTPELKEEIQEIIQDSRFKIQNNTAGTKIQNSEENTKYQIPNTKYSAYWIPRKNILFGKWIRHTGWYPDHQLRLFKQGSVKFPCKRIHEDPEINGETAKLTHPLIHYNYASISHFIQKLNKYTDVDAQGYLPKLTHPYSYHLINRVLDEFIKRFLALEGYKDGLHGLILSLLQSFYELVVVAKAIELKQFEDQETNLIQLVEEEAKGKLRDWKWWKGEMAISMPNGIFNQLILRLKRKLGL